MRTPIKTILLVVTAVLAVTTTAHARSWRVNSDATKKAHFLDLNAACASEDVQAGDTLYLDPGCKITTQQNVTKKLTIIGCGYLLGGGIQQATITGRLVLQAAGIKVEGVEVTGYTNLCANNIVLERCKLRDVNNAGTAQYAIIRQCYIPNGKIWGAGPTSIETSNWTIENSIIIYSDGYDPISLLYYPIIRNNYLHPKYTSSGSASIAYVSRATILNNISINTRFPLNGNIYDSPDCLVLNNVFHIASYSTEYPGNIIIDSNTEEAVFALEGTNDQRYQLKEDSPAKGAAADGGDCGPFGGMYPYVPSGRPLGIPYIESTSRPTRAVDGQVKVSQTVRIQAK